MEATDPADEPFQPLRSLVPPKSTDEEYVAKIAKSLRGWQRWRWLAVLFHTVMLGGIVWLGFNVVDLVRGFQGMLPNQDPSAMLDVVVPLGILLGLKVGFLLQASMMGIISALTGFRTERLLIQYRDNLQVAVADTDSDLVQGGLISRNS